MNPYLQILRPVNCAIAAVAVLVAGVMSRGLALLGDIPLLSLLLAMATVASFTGAGNALNDYFDAETDRVNHPGRPIPSGRLSKLAALRVTVILFLISVILSTLINQLSFLIVVISLFIMVSYEKWTKGAGVPGNLTISWLTGCLFLFAGAALGGLGLMSILALLAFMATLGREIAKDMEDITGDMDRRTLPKRVGMTRAGAVSYMAFAAAVALSPLPLMLGYFSVWYMYAVVVADGMFIYCAAVVFKNPHRTQVLAKGAMVLALASFVVGGIVG